MTPKAIQERALLPGDGSVAAIKAVAQAEQALDQLSVNFDDWMRIEVDKLLQAKQSLKDIGPSEAGLDALFGVSHDLKGQAATLGYPFVADICVSLCRLIDACGKGGRIPVVLVEQHIDAVAAIVREDAKGPDHAKASILARKLYDVTQDYLVQISRRQGA